MNILLVDDQAFNRDLLRFIMEDEGHTCIEAADGRQAIEALEKNPQTDIILMDVNMPVMGGIEATREIKKIEREKPVAIIFITAFDDGKILTSCLDAGGDDFIPKPISEAILISKVNVHARSIENYLQLLDAKKHLDEHNQQVHREHEIVETIFENVQSVATTKPDNIISYSSPMSMFNGDVLLNASSPSGGLYFLVGDFTGHGLAAAVGSLPVMSIFYSSAAKQSSVSEIAREINNQLNKILPLELFFCASIGHLDRSGERLILWSGGMNDALLHNAETQHITSIEGEHMPLGIHKQSEFDDTVQIHTLPEESRLYIYTDGINEAQAKNGEQFGDDRVIDVLTGYDQKNVKHVIHEIVDQVTAFSESQGQDDDISIIELKCVPCVHRNIQTHDIVDVRSHLHSVQCFPWRLDLTLSGDELKATDTIHQVVSFLSTIPNVDLHQDKLFTIVSELYNNSLEHGLLGLESSLKDTPDGFEEYYSQRISRLDNIGNEKIHICLEYIKGCTDSVKIMITDTGKGFDFSRALARSSSDEQAHGRGLGLIKLLCSTLEYSNEGRTVCAVYEFIL